MSGWGQRPWGFNRWGGQASTIVYLGAVWGARGWGEEAWGDNGVTTFGTGAIGSVVVSYSSIAYPTGVVGTGAVGTVVTNYSNLTIPTGVEGTGAIGTIIRGGWTSIDVSQTPNWIDIDVAA